MPRALKTDKFFLYAPRKSGHWKNKGLLGINGSYNGDISDINLKDLIEFLREKGVDPLTVHFHGYFTAHIRTE